MSDPSPQEAEELPVHVEKCWQRYTDILGRIKRLEWILVGLVVLGVVNGDGPLTKFLGGFLVRLFVG